MYAIKDQQSEPYHQHQNYAERRIQEVKNTSTIIMDRAKAPNCLWYHCLKYAVVLLNHLSSKGLDYKMPIEKAFGVTSDISALIQFYFYQPVLYLDTNKPSYAILRNYLVIGLVLLRMLVMHLHIKY